MTRAATTGGEAAAGESAAVAGTACRLRSAAASLFFPAERRKDPFWVLALITVVSGTLAAIRLGRAGLNTIWAEDGQVFYQGAIDHPLRSFLEPWHGYLETTPRVIASIVALFPVSWAAAANGVADALALGLLAALAYHACGEHIRTPWLRLVPVAVTAICPIGQETWDSTANLMWAMYFVVFLVLLWNPRRPLPITIGAVTAVLLTLTSPFGLLLAPVAVARIVALGRDRGSVIPVATLAGTLLQTADMATSGGRQSYTTVLPGRLANDYALNVAERGFFGLRYLLFGARDTGDYRALGAVVVAAVVTALVLAGAAGKGRKCALAALALAYSVGYYAVVIVASGTLIGKGGGDRYYVGPLLLLAYAVTVVFDAAVVGLLRDGSAPWAAGVRSAWLRVAGYVPRLAALTLCAALTACLAFSIVTDWNIPDKHRQSPTWPAALAGARAWCAHEPGGATARIRIDASFPTDPWYVRLTCSEIS